MFEWTFLGLQKASMQIAQLNDELKGFLTQKASEFKSLQEQLVATQKELQSLKDENKSLKDELETLKKTE